MFVHKELIKVKTYIIFNHLKQENRTITITVSAHYIIFM